MRGVRPTSGVVGGCWRCVLVVYQSNNTLGGCHQLCMGRMAGRLLPHSSRRQASDKCSHFAASTGVPFFGQTCCARAPTSLPFSPFSFLIFYRYFFLSSSQSDPLVRCWSVEELTMANMALFQIIVQQVLPFCVSIFYLNAFVDCQFLSPPKLQSLLSVAAVCATEGFLIRR